MNPVARPRLVTIEDVVGALALQCDGARSRDGRGFSRADAQEGGRLAAMKTSGIPWSRQDADRALEIATRYARQAGMALGEGRETRAEGIEKSLRAGRVILAEEPVAASQPYNYCCLSPGGKRVYFWRMAWLQDLKDLSSRIFALSRERHGVRRISFDREEADLTINGQRRRFPRLAIDFNGTTQVGILAAARAHGFAVEPAIQHPIDVEIDALRRQERSVWLHEGIRDGTKGTWAVFDLARRHEPFSSDMKSMLRGRFECDPKDDWNWWVEWSPDTQSLVLEIGRRHGFAMSTDMTPKI